MADQALVNFCTKLNPVFDMQGLRKENPLARPKDYICEEKDARLRVQLVQKKGMEQRVDAYKEELRTHQYMVDKGYIKEAKTKEDVQAAIR